MDVGKNPHGQLAVNTSGNNAQRSSPVQVPASLGIDYMVRWDSHYTQN